MEFDAYFTRLDDETYAPTTGTSSPWDPRLQHGGPPTALLVHAIEKNHPRDDVRVARVASEFLGIIPREPMRVRTRVVRPGRRIEMAEATAEIGGREVLAARVWRIAVQPEGSVPPGVTAPDAAPPLPEAEHTWLSEFGYGRSVEWRYVSGMGALGPAAVWSRLRVPLVEGEPIAPLDRAIVVADSANGISGELPMGDWLFVPPSLSLAFERYPRGEWVLLEARTTLASDGIGVTSARVADLDGYFGLASQALYVERRSPAPQVAS
jgi:hypothetical protein